MEGKVSDTRRAGLGGPASCHVYRKPVQSRATVLDRAEHEEVGKIHFVVGEGVARRDLGGKINIFLDVSKGAV